MMRDMKPNLARDPARVALASAIALHAGAARDLQVAEEAAKLAESRFYDALSKLDELRNEPPAPSGSLAAEFTASIVTGNPCTSATLERASVAAGAKLTAAENDVNVWKQTHEECELAVRAKEADVATAKERVERCARMVICNAEMVSRLADGLAAMQDEIVERRSALRFISRHGCNGELPAPLAERVEKLMWQNLEGMESTSASAAWASAFEELQSNSDAALPGEFAGVS